MTHYIGLTDCDCFFVSAERAFNRKLEGIPVVVLSNNDGCIISRSKEAKDLGVKMGEPYFMAKNRVKDVLYVRANHDLYQSISFKVMNILKNFAPDVEVCSIDEAFIDLTGTKLLYKQNYIKTATMIRNEIWNKLHIPVSIGLSTTKTLAKLASDKAKNNGGIFAIGQAKRNKILATTSIADISGVGKKLNQKMREECIFTALDFVCRPDYWIKGNFGKHGMDLKNELSGISLFKVERENKPPLSIQQTSALKEFSSDLNVLKSALNKHIHKACKRARSENLKAVFIEVMLRSKDFRIFTSKIKLNFPTNQENEINAIALNELIKIYSPLIVWRSVGITLSGLIKNDIKQEDLFIPTIRSNEKFGKLLDQLEAKFGKDIVHFG